eukprot:GHRR01027169.1.p2 GENE.GHRR01027169.1~~GHRR01027169.1.p2  ORF type:complete len:102 (+),score=19.89 GHRR01027169.1:275-580(+)
MQQQRKDAISKSWCCLESSCGYCGGEDYSSGAYGPRNLILCSCCNHKGTHVACYEKKTGNVLTEEFINSGSSWFCSTVRCCYLILWSSIAKRSGAAFTFQQ